MALIERFHVVAAERPVATGETIKEGMVVSLNNAGEVVIQGTGPNGTFVLPYGLAGDTKSTSASSMPGVYSGWQNRVSDYFDETKASAKMTVYHSGGEFATDMFRANVGALTTTMAPLYAINGYLVTVDSQASGVVARLVKCAGYEMSGVPGVDTNGDMALKSEAYTSTGSDSTYTDKYIEIKLVI